MKEKILIIEDNPDLAAAIEYNLQQEGYTTQIVDNGMTSLAVAKSFQPDLVVLDIMLPGLGGFDVCRRLKSDERTRRIAIVMLTVRSSEADVVLGLELGADDYVTKPFSPRVLLARIKSVLRREASHQEAPRTIRYRSLMIDNEKREIRKDGAPLAFSKTEFEILALLVSKPGKVFSRNTILQRCWPDGVVVIDRSVDVHMNSIRKKLEGMASCIETVRGIGYRVKEE